MEFLDILKWSASFSGMVAAVMVAWNGGAKLTGFGFILFSISSIIWIIASVMNEEPPLAVQNVVLLGINLFGIYRYLVKQAA